MLSAVDNEQRCKSLSHLSPVFKKASFLFSLPLMIEGFEGGNLYRVQALTEVGQNIIMFERCKYNRDGQS